MEFYYDIDHFVILENWFQFSTGWNSTEAKKRKEKKDEIVSIPNGMEFYCSSALAPLLLRAFQFPTGWNSTLFLGRGYSFHILVSIPNGMEFYIDFEVVELAWLQRFNSQRDGILHGGWSNKKYYNKSFNSQRDGILRQSMQRILQLSSVSIPNGMEFYRSDQ